MPVEFTESPRYDRERISTAELLSRIYLIVDQTVRALEQSDDPKQVQMLSKKVQALKDLCRALPQLQKFESTTHVEDKNKKNIEDWRPEELEASVLEALGHK